MRMPRLNPGLGAVVLILIGVLFLLHTLGLSEFGIDRFWPIFVIILGGWLFARNFGLLVQLHVRMFELRYSRPNLVIDGSELLGGYTRIVERRLQ